MNGYCSGCANVVSDTWLIFGPLNTTQTSDLALVFDATNNRWIPGNVQTQLNSIGDISGVDIADVENGYTLVYNDGIWALNR